MSALDRLAATLVRAAARRWPADLREDRLAEWSAELHVLRGKPLAALRFALSLACSPAVEEGHASAGWREQLPGLGRTLQAVLVLLVVGATAPMLVDGISSIAHGLMPDSTGAVGEGLAGLAALALLLFVGVWLGRRLGTALPLSGRLRAAGAAAALLLVGLGQYLSQLVEHALSTGTPVDAPSTTAILTWGLKLALLAVAYVAARLSMRGYGRWAAAVAVGGVLAILEALGVVVGLRPELGTQAQLATAPLWSPLALLYAPSTTTLARFEQLDIVVSQVGYVIRPLAVMAAFGLAFGLAAARSPRALMTRRLDTVDPNPDAVPARWSSWLGLGTVTAGVLMWAVTIAVVTPAQRATLPVMRATYHMSRQSFEEMVPLLAEELLVPLLEQQLTAVLIATLGVVIFLARRGPVILPASLVAVALVAVDVLLARNQIGGVPAFGAVLAAGAAAVWAATALSKELGATGPGHARRVLTGAAVLAALCAPSPFFAGAMWGSLDLVPGYRVVAGLLAAMLAGLAAAAALAARTERPSSWLVAITVGGPAVVMVTFGVLFVYRSEWTQLAPASAPLLAVLTLAASTWTTDTSAWRWLRLGIGAVVLGVPLAVVQVFAGIPLGSGLVAAAAYSLGSDSLPHLPGVLTLGLPLAMSAARRAVPGHPIAEPAPHTVLPPDLRPSPAELS
jgi:hypothetical protein